ncbi:hypothetical protein ACSU1N_03580 [Thermogladius sp. 4427co]|uniref:hypothetical protein n=1 Tax=Thermogladius sp. 4427co TaxID=3450718 RepID=UPI003F792A23
MIVRNLIAGLNIIAVSLLLLIYGFLNNSGPIIGISSSILVVGIVIVFTSLGTSEGITLSLREYSETASIALAAILEDADSLRVKPVYVRNPDGGEFIVFFKGTPSGRVRPGVGYSDAPYLALPVRNMLVNHEAIADESELKEALCSERGLCDNVHLVEEEGSLRLVFVNVPSETRELLSYPLNPLVVACLVAVGRIRGRPVRLSDISIVGSNVEIVLNEVPV